MGYGLFSEVKLGGRYPSILGAVSKSLPGAAAQYAPLPSGKPALFVIWPGFENREKGERRRLVRDAILAALRISAFDYLAGIQCFTPREFEELMRNDITAFAGEEFGFTVTLTHELGAGDTVDVEWRGPLNEEKRDANVMPIYANDARQVSGTIYNISGSVPAGYSTGYYQTTRARVVNHSGEVLAEIPEVMTRYLSVEGSQEG